MTYHAAVGKLVWRSEFGPFRSSLIDQKEIGDCMNCKLSRNDKQAPMHSRMRVKFSEPVFCIDGTSNPRGGTNIIG